MSSSDTDTSQGPKLGQICWLEIPVTDPARAIAFYQSVLDWDCKADALPGHVPHVKQINFFTKGSLNGAFNTVDAKDLVKVADEHNPTQQSVVANYAVASIEETLEKVKNAGGKVIL